jgi:ligand-binding sensor domain-containing protein
VWVSNSKVTNSISVKTSDDEWKALSFSFLIGSVPVFGDMIIDQNNQLWAIIKDVGIMVYDGSLNTPDESNTKLLTNVVGNGNLPNTEVHCLIEDLKGTIWIGTNGGMVAIYNPGSVFTGDDYDAQEIFVEEELSTQILFATELVQTIAIDGANRKWVGTANAGVFLMTEDATVQILHYTIKNSPLLSNNVSIIEINPRTGENYFGTEKGLVSYRGEAMEAFATLENAYAYPNPITPDYSGPIAIVGLTKNASVKITDINGQIVFETTSLGGQAIWDGKNRLGNRVSTGVYLVFCATEDGGEKVATKILFIN